MIVITEVLTITNVLFSTQTWPAVTDMITHVRAPTSFLTNQLHAYGQWLNFSIQSTRPSSIVSFSDNRLVVMEGGPGG